MKLNIHILFDELKDLSPQINTFKDIDLTLCQIRIPEFEENDLRKDCIYVMEASEIEARTQMLDGIDLISIGRIDFQNEAYSSLSIITLSEDCRKTDILGRVQDIFEKYEFWNDSLMWSIAANEPLQVVADNAASILANPFAIMDITMEKIVKGGKVPENYKGTIWEVVLEEDYTPSETYSIPPDDLYFFQNYNEKPYLRDDLPFAGYSYLIANLYLGGKLFALLCSTDINAPFTQGQVSLTQHIRNAMELCIASSIEFKGTTESVFYYIEHLIKGFPVDDKVLNYHLTKRNWSVCGNFRLYTISNSNGADLSDSQARFCIYRIKKLQEDMIIFSFDNSIIIITKQSINDSDIDFQKELAALLSKLGLCGGFSQVFNCFNQLRDYYIQSKAALNEGEKRDVKGVLWDFTDYYFSFIMSTLINSTNLKSLCHPNLLRLQEHDKINGTNFVHCLQVYLFNGCNIAQTGKDLFLHRNTLTYRLEKIAEIIEMDVHKLAENERMQLWFSCKICGNL